MTTMAADRFSVRRAASLTRWNTILLSRNRVAFFYAAVFPMVPLALLFTGDRGDESLGASAITTGFLVASLFTIYYNVLSQFVNRRDELVLKRMRTGEAQDAELLVSIALPGAISTLLVSAIVVPLAAALGQPLPVNPLLYGALVLLVVAAFSAFAFWTAAWDPQRRVRSADQPAAHPPGLARADGQHDPRHVRSAARDPLAHGLDARRHHARPARSDGSRARDRLVRRSTPQQREGADNGQVSWDEDDPHRS